MSSQRKKRNRSAGSKMNPAVSSQSAITTDAAGAPVNFNLQFNQLSLPGDYVGALQVAATLPSAMQEKVIHMAEKEQAHRHKMDMMAVQQQYELSKDNQTANYNLKKQKQDKTYASEMCGKAFGFIVLGGFLSAVVYLCITENFRGLALIMGSAAILGVLIKAFVWLMGQNKNS